MCHFTNHFMFGMHQISHLSMVYKALQFISNSKHCEIMKAHTRWGTIVDY